ncbi:S-adenosyl-L-methionine-dependent tRNA 4-demethylwyosine synthase TYW1 isoform X1, partial [Tachysurus ichikawai]
MDPAEKILQEALENHRNLIRQFRGVPGVRPERFEEGLAVKHCALSLVGEPIMYPEINSFLRLLHRCHISSFLVTNAQFPEEI